MMCLSSPDNQWKYKVFCEDSGNIFSIGFLQKNNLEKDFWNIQKFLMGREYRKGEKKVALPKKIPFLQIIGIRTVATIEENPMNENLHPVFQRSRIWNVPLLIGFPTLYFQIPRG